MHLSHTIKKNLHDVLDFVRGGTKEEPRILPHSEILITHLGKN